jgi:hypothetical protein
LKMGWTFPQGAHRQLFRRGVESKVPPRGLNAPGAFDPHRRDASPSGSVDPRRIFSASSLVILAMTREPSTKGRGEAECPAASGEFAAFRVLLLAYSLLFYGIRRPVE